ncbi:hypothetical protein BJV78DRAFT_420610 [Lactifluus subvellereus]|nr:hypothetical protein BJV78DRAFT_420610 [Lactifluus subvellereus]
MATIAFASIFFTVLLSSWAAFHLQKRPFHVSQQPGKGMFCLCGLLSLLLTALTPRTPRRLALLLRLLRLRVALTRLTWLVVDGCLCRGVSVPGVMEDDCSVN